MRTPFDSDPECSRWRRQGARDARHGSAPRRRGSKGIRERSSTGRRRIRETLGTEGSRSVEDRRRGTGEKLGFLCGKWSVRAVRVGPSSSDAPSEVNRSVNLEGGGWSGGQAQQQQHHQVEAWRRPRREEAEMHWTDVDVCKGRNRNLLIQDGGKEAENRGSNACTTSYHGPPYGKRPSHPKGRLPSFPRLRKEPFSGLKGN